MAEATPDSSENCGIEPVPSHDPSGVKERLAEEDLERRELFEQYAHHTTNLRNWFIAYGVGGLLLLTRADAAFNVPGAHAEPGLKIQAMALFIFGLAAQVALTMINKMAHYYAYQAYVVPPSKRHRLASWVCECFWVDIVCDVATLVFYLLGTFWMTRLVT